MRKIAIGICVVAFSFVLQGCAPKLKDVMSPSDLASLLKDDGYIVLRIPDANMKPGAIFQLVGEGNAAYPSYLGHLNDCGVPAERTAVIVGGAPQATLNRTVTINGSANVEFSIRAIKGITVGPSIKDADTAKYTITEAGRDGLNIIQISNWLGSPDGTKFSSVCRSYFDNPSIFVIREAFRVSKAKYELVNKSGSKIDLKIPASPVLSVGLGAGVDVDADGSLVVNSPYYFGIRRARQIGSMFVFLGDQKAVPEETDAAKDARLSGASSSVPFTAR